MDVAHESWCRGAIFEEVAGKVSNLEAVTLVYTFSVMSHTTTQRLLALLCLMAFGLGQTFSTVFVRCEEDLGQATYEFVCLKTSDGSCKELCHAEPACVSKESTDCEGGNNQHLPHPCKDTLIGVLTNASKALRQSNIVQLAAFVAVVLVYGQDIMGDEPRVLRFAACAFEHARLPDTVWRLRSVIMTV